jgi:hypothetical protein
MAQSNVNVPLLNFVAHRILLDLSTPKKEMAESVHIKGELPREDKVPYLYRPQKDVLPNVERYAREVLEFVDGNRSIKDIIEESHLSAEQVWDVILAYRRSSEVYFKE